MLNEKNMSYFYQISKSNNRLAKDIKNLFVSEVPKELVLLNEAIERKDYQTIRSASVRLKSSLSFVGLNSELVKTIEEKSASGADIEHITEMFANVKSVCDNAIQELEGV